MQESFKVILQIQDIDIKMIRLLRVKKERQKELNKIQALKTDFEKQVSEKQEQILEIKKQTRMGETSIKEMQEKIAKLEDQQGAVKKMDEFNALTQEMTAAGKARTQTENRLAELADKLNVEEDLFEALKKNLESTQQNSIALEKEIRESIALINAEGQTLLKEREALIPTTNKTLFGIYEKLLRNKKDRVVVSIENRTCSGCHIVLTAQHENLVRRAERLVFCEHCSRLLYWKDAELPEGDEEASPRRRRRKSTTAA